MVDELTRAAEDSARSSFFLILGTATSTVTMAIASILIGRFLGPDLYGQYTLVLVVPQMLFLFTDLGINQGITKFTANLNTNGENQRSVSLIRHGLTYAAEDSYTSSHT